MRKLIATFFGMFLFIGCSGFKLPPVDSGVLEIHSGYGGGQIRTSKLESTQIKAISDWFSAHVTGWERTLDDVSPAVIAYLKHDNVVVAYVNIRGNDIYSGGYHRVLTPEERKAIDTIFSADLISADRVDPLPSSMPPH